MNKALEDVKLDHMMRNRLLQKISNRRILESCEEDDEEEE